MRSHLLNGGAYARADFLAINKTLTAAGAGDNTLVQSAYVDRMPNSKGMAMSVKVVLAYTATLAAGKSLFLAAQGKSADDTAGTNAANFGTALAATKIATSAGGGTVNGTVELDFDLSGCGRCFGIAITPDLDATATDIAEWSATLISFGHQTEPVSLSLV